MINGKNGQGTHSTKMGSDKSAENTPKPICPKVWDFDEKKASLGFRSPWLYVSIKDSHMYAKICEPSFKNNYNPLLSSSCRHPLPWILTVVSNWIKWHATLRIEKKTGNFYLFFICFDAKMSFMFLLAYCHDLGYGTFVPSIMISDYIPPSHQL